MDIFAFLGGLALFLFGLYQIRTAMETFMKGRLRSVIGRMTAGTVRTIALGTGLTMLMQSSMAVTVVTVGMVESGALEKRKAFLLVMGANLGTTATAWLVALGASGGEKKSGNTVLLVLLCLGVLMEYFQRSAVKNGGMLLSGMGALFLGVEGMGTVMDVFPGLYGILPALGKNSLAALGAGMLLACMVQSSSAGIGILQVLAERGVIPAQAGMYMILGENIGTCVTTLAAGVGTGAAARSVTWFHLFFNVVGTMAALPVLAAIFHLLPQAGTAMGSAVGLAMFHTMFNAFNIAVFGPWIHQMQRINRSM